MPRSEPADPGGARGVHAPEKAWAVVNPHGIRWQARFYTSRAAWMRAMAQSRKPGETPNAARARLLAEGWKVEPATK